MNNIDSVRIAGQEVAPSSEFSGGLIAIERVRPDDLALPVQISLVSADVSEKPQLDMLYPMSSISDYPFGMLRPSGLDPEIFSSASFRDSLSCLQQQLQMLAVQRHPGARKFGRLARVLSRQDDLFRLAQMYASALIQG